MSHHFVHICKHENGHEDNTNCGDAKFCYDFNYTVKALFIHHPIYFEHWTSKVSDMGGHHPQKSQATIIVESEIYGAPSPGVTPQKPSHIIVESQKLIWFEDLWVMYLPHMYSVFYQ